MYKNSIISISHIFSIFLGRLRFPSLLRWSMISTRSNTTCGSSDPVIRSGPLGTVRLGVLDESSSSLCKGSLASS